METSLTIEEMQQAYRNSDASYDGLFVLGVRTTGIFCRPTCPARKAQPDNVEFFMHPADATAAGYRPCKRCRPTAPVAEPAWATRLLAAMQQDPALRLSDHDLKDRGIDPSTVRRYFLSHYGITFQAFARAHRLTAALNALRQGAPIEDAIAMSGFESHSGFRDAFARQFGQTPGRGEDVDCVHLTWLTTPLGPVIAAATEAGLCLLDFADRFSMENQFSRLGKLFNGPIVPGPHRHFETLRYELNAYFTGKLQSFHVPIHFYGTPFQEEVWRQLQRIPYGETCSYADLAAAVRRPRAVRAVGTANGANRIGIIVPCHRVVNHDGRLGGYGGGLRRKEFLLNLERRVKSDGELPSRGASG